MKNSSFRFKQFTVYHDKCAMKVGTDGVLLGAWTNAGTSAIRILDVGTGTGLIALMLAQKNNCADITAIEIDDKASMQAKDNVSLSPFSDKIDVVATSFQEFVKNTSTKFDLIVSNPPFFVNSLLPPNHSRSHARHADTLSLQELLHCCHNIIKPQGSISFIYPYEEILDIDQLIIDEGWHIKRQTDVYSKPDSALPKRLLLELTNTKPIEEPIKNKLVIEIDRHQYSHEYIALTKDFYLKM